MYRHQQHPKLFPEHGLIEILAIDLLVPLSKTTKGNQFVIFIIVRYSKLTRAVPLTKMTASHVFDVFVDNLRILRNETADEKRLPSPNKCQMQRYKEDIVSRLRQYVNEN